MRGVWKSKVAIPFLASLVLESGAFSYSKANEAMQAYDAAGATRMYITPGTPIYFQKLFQWMRLTLFGACLAATVILGIGPPPGRGQQPQQKAPDLDLSLAVPPSQFPPLTATRP